MRHKSVPGSQWPVASKFQNKNKNCHPERSQAKSEAIGLAESKDPYSSSPLPVAAGSSHDESALLLLLFRRSLLSRRFLVRHMLLRGLPRPRRAFHLVAALVFAALVRLFHLLLFFHQRRRLERLPIKRNLCNPDRRIVLPESAQLLVLLLALVMEDQDLLTASLLDHLAGYARARTRRHNAARLGRNRQHVAELHKSIRVGLFFHPDHIARGDTVLFSTCADHRVHKLSLCSCRDGALPRPSRAQLGRYNLVLAVFPQRLVTGNAARPQNGSASTGKLN